MGQQSWECSFDLCPGAASEGALDKTVPILGWLGGKILNPADPSPVGLFSGSLEPGIVLLMSDMVLRSTKACFQ